MDIGPFNYAINNEIIKFNIKLSLTNLSTQYFHKFLRAQQLYDEITKCNVSHRFINTIYPQISSRTIYNNYTMKSSRSTTVSHKFINTIYPQISRTICNTYAIKSSS